MDARALPAGISFFKVNKGNYLNIVWNLIHQNNVSKVVVGRGIFYEKLL